MKPKERLPITREKLINNLMEEIIKLGALPLVMVYAVEDKEKGGHHIHIGNLLDVSKFKKPIIGVMEKYLNTYRDQETFPSEILNSGTTQ